ncbi:hypothetical protein BC835DRAFT_246703 [Cytidiella melzeri]|nr:hypothetical protein BC835DRAFT_246703 [Cytidiella melzeri]
MLSKLFVASAFLLGLTAQVSAHALITPALGVTGAGARSDVQRPSTSTPCGTVNIAQTINTSQAAQLSAQGTVAATITNFNAWVLRGCFRCALSLSLVFYSSGVDGSRDITNVQVDPTGTGKSFVAATMVVNGIQNPTDVTSQPLTVQLPANTQCIGGTGKNTCLLSFTTAGGFGNCIAVQQGAAAATASVAGNATAAAGNATAAAGNTTVAAGNATSAAANATAAAGKHRGGKKGKAAAAKGAAASAAAKRDTRAYGTRAARALRRAMEEIQEWL